MTRYSKAAEKNPLSSIKCSCNSILHYGWTLHSPLKPEASCPFKVNAHARATSDFWAKWILNAVSKRQKYSRIIFATFDTITPAWLNHSVPYHAVWCWARYRRVFTALRIITISHDSVEYMNMANQRHSDESDWIPNRPWTLSDCQCVPRHLDSHREKTTGTSWALTLWLCCSWNKLLVRLARRELVPRLSLISPKVFFSVLSPMEFWFLAAVASDTSFPVICRLDCTNTI